MGLNPSNILDEDLKGFPTLGDPPFPEEYKNIAIAELHAVELPRDSITVTTCEREIFKQDSEAHKLACMGITIPGIAKPEDTEWVQLHRVTAHYLGWNFTRAWYYWIVYVDEKDYAIPKRVAKDFNNNFGNEVRVAGFAGGQDVQEDVESYHIDTPRGLAAFMPLIKKRVEEVEHMRHSFVHKMLKKNNDT